MKQKLPKNKHHRSDMRLYKIYPVPPSLPKGLCIQFFEIYDARVCSIYCSPEYAFQDKLPQIFCSRIYCIFPSAPYPFRQFQVVFSPKIQKTYNLSGIIGEVIRTILV